MSKTAQNSLGWLESKNQITSVSENVKQSKPSYTIHRNEKTVQPSWKIVWQCLTLLLYDPGIPLLGIYQEKWKYIFTHTKKNLTIYSKILYNSQKLGKTQMSLRRWTDKQIVVYPFKEPEHINQKECRTVTSHGMDQSWNTVCGRRDEL